MGDGPHNVDLGLPCPPLASLRLVTVLEPEATHTESAWMSRLPSALTFLLGPWWV